MRVWVQAGLARASGRRTRRRHRDRAGPGRRAVLGWPGTRITVGSAPRPTACPGVAHALRRSSSPPVARPRRRRPAPPPRRRPDADAAVLFTSGSTGPAKGVVYTHRRLAAMRDVVARTYGMQAGRPARRRLRAVRAARSGAGRDVRDPGHGRHLTADAHRPALAEAAAAVDATVVFASPAALANVLATADGLTPASATRARRASRCSSRPAPRSRRRCWRGCSELMPAAVAAHPVRDDRGPAGHGHRRWTGSEPPARATASASAPPWPGSGVARQRRSTPTARADRPPRPPPGRHGRDLVAAPHVKERYDRLWLTAAAPARRDPGWHRTGDVGHLDDDGRLWVEGRLAHVLATADGRPHPGRPRAAGAGGAAGAGRAAVVGVGPPGTQQVVVASSKPSPPVRRPARGAGRSPRGARRRRRRHRRRAPCSWSPHCPPTSGTTRRSTGRALAGWADRVLAGEPGRP